jgi:hypothetical protein
MADCKVPCHNGSLRLDELQPKLRDCEKDTLSISGCGIDSPALAPLRDQPHPDMRLALRDVSGTIDLHGTQLRDFVLVQSSGPKVDRIDLRDGKLDRVSIAPPTDQDPLRDAYLEKPFMPDKRSEPNRMTISTVDAQGCHATTFALLASDSTAVNLQHLRVDDTLDLTWTKATAFSMRFADVTRVEAARLAVNDLDMFGVRTSQISLAWAELGTLNAETASVERVLSLRHTTIKGRMDGCWLSAGSIVFDYAQTQSVDLCYAHLGLI